MVTGIRVQSRWLDRKTPPSCSFPTNTQPKLMQKKLLAVQKLQQNLLILGCFHLKALVRSFKLVRKLAEIYRNASTAIAMIETVSTL